MSKKLYVGNLSYKVSNGELALLFAAHGTVESAHVIIDRDTGHSKGFGFVEMSTDQEAQAAMTALNGQQISGRHIRVTKARPPQHRDSSRTFGGGSDGDSRAKLPISYD